MSGGVDSSVSAALMKEKGYNVFGLTIKTWGYDGIPENETGCCSLDTIYRAQMVANQLDIRHYTLDFTEEFNEVVIENFVSEYMNGRTPNPCVLCNKSIKWGPLLEKSKSLGADYLVTGHYAKIKKNPENGRYYIERPEDKHKDQSYFLWALSQSALSKTLFPLSDYTKPEIRKIASTLNLKSASTPDSQEICFVPNNDYTKLLEIRIPEINKDLENGDVIYKGKVVGKHRGYPYYTIGQRKGLYIALGKPVYVSKIDAKNNIIVIDDEDGLLSTDFSVKNVNLMYCENIEEEKEVLVKVRYKDVGTMGTIRIIDNDNIKVKLFTPKKSITPGQSAVFYEGDILIGGGVIE